MVCRYVACLCGVSGGSSAVMTIAVYGGGYGYNHGATKRQKIIWACFYAVVMRCYGPHSLP